MQGSSIFPTMSDVDSNLMMMMMMIVVEMSGSVENSVNQSENTTAWQHKHNCAASGKKWDNEGNF